MEMKLGEWYRDGRGRVWEVIGVDGFPLYPVTVARWEGKHYATRCFQRDGRFFVERPDTMDLIELVPNPIRKDRQ